MQINLHTDTTIEHHTGLDQHVQAVVSAAIGRFQEHITRVEVHLSDKNSQKSSDGDNRCMLEARVTGMQPIAVSDHAATLHQAISGAAEKLKRALDSALGRLHDIKRHTSAKVGDSEPDSDQVSE